MLLESGAREAGLIHEDACKGEGAGDGAAWGNHHEVVVICSDGSGDEEQGKDGPGGGWRRCFNAAGQGSSGAGAALYSPLNASLVTAVTAGTAGTASAVDTAGVAGTVSGVGAAGATAAAALEVVDLTLVDVEEQERILRSIQVNTRRSPQQASPSQQPCRASKAQEGVSAGKRRRSLERSEQAGGRRRWVPEDKKGGGSGGGGDGSTAGCGGRQLQGIKAFFSPVPINKRR